MIAFRLVRHEKVSRQRGAHKPARSDSAEDAQQLISHDCESKASKENLLTEFWTSLRNCVQ